MWPAVSYSKTKDNAGEEKYKPILLMNIDAKPLKCNFSIKFQKYVERIIHHDQSIKASFSPPFIRRIYVS